MLVERLKQEGTSYNSRDLLKICVKMEASRLAQVFKQDGVTPSGPGAFLLLLFLKTWDTSSSLIWSTGVGERGVAWGVNGCVERWSGWVGGGFQNYNKTHSGLQQVVDSPQCWGMVSCRLLGDGFQAFPNWSGVIGIELIFQLFNVGPFSVPCLSI